MLVSTPIGNLGDLAPRAAAALREADAVLCEDTRVTRTLLASQGIGTRMISLHEHNESARIAGLLDEMRAGRRFVLVSDAGSPVIADPGFRLVRAAIEAGLSVSAIPGPNAALTALALSGLPPHPFLFLGFLPPKSAARRTALAAVADAEAAGLAATVVFYEAPHRLAATLGDCLAVLGDREAAIGRELTKRFEEVLRGRLTALVERFREAPPRGEVTVVLQGMKPEAPAPESVDDALRAALAEGSVRDAADRIARAFGLKRRTVYERALRLRDG